MVVTHYGNKGILFLYFYPSKTIPECCTEILNYTNHMDIYASS